jgi:hypothetical protein
MRTAQKITSLFLVVILLVSSLGFTANKMICLKSGKTKLSLVNIKDCCPENESSVPVIKSDCCNITNTFFDLNDFQGVQKSEVCQPLVMQAFYDNSSAKPDFIFVSSDQVFSCSDLPPPRSGKIFLSFISTYII